LPEPAAQPARRTLEVKRERRTIRMDMAFL